MMNTGEAEAWLGQQLRNCYEDGEAKNIAALVMEHLTGWNNGNRRLHGHAPLTEQQQQQLADINNRLQQHEPVQYVLEEAWFYDFKLFVNRSVLIPRPETEELVYWIVQDVQAAALPVFERGTANADKTNVLKIMDVGTGSGCIALALKRKMPLAEVWGCDASEDALNVARRNGSELDIRVDFAGLDFLDTAQRRQLPTVDIIVSNPPYIPLHESESMPRNVVGYEPHQALFVPDGDPLIFYKAVAQFAEERLYPNGAIYLEIHEGLGNEVVQFFKEAGYQTVLRKDMQGKDRMIKAWR